MATTKSTPQTPPVVGAAKTPVVNFPVIDRVQFFTELKRSLFKKFTQLQVDGINAILDECQLQKITNVHQIGYIFGTAYKEGFDPKGEQTGVRNHRLVPIRELGSDKYLRSKSYWPHVGLGYVQLTWEYNYATMQVEIQKSHRFPDVNIVKVPEQALRIDVAAFILVYGMKHGVYTQKHKLSHFINNETTDYKNARRIVNRLDCWEEIAGFAKAFTVALNNSIPK